MKPKLLHITYQFHPEMGYDVNLFATYADPGMEVIILTSDNLDLWNTTAAEVAEKDNQIYSRFGVRIIRLRSFKTGKKKAGIFIPGLNSAIDRINPQIIFFHGLESVTFAWSIFRQLGKRYVVADTHTLFNQFIDLTFLGGLYLKGLFKPLIIRKMRKWNCPVFYTAKENKRVLEWYGFPDSQIYNNEICTNLEVFRKVETDRNTVFPGIDPHSKVILYTGKFDHFKQPALILDAIKTVQDKVDFNLSVVFVGPRNESYITTLLKQEPENKNIKIFIQPAVSNHELYLYYSAADIAVFPRQNTLSSLDAQACGLPVIMERDETNSERLQKGGVCYESGDMKDLGEKILELLTNEDLRNQLSEQGPLHMRDRYNYSKKMAEIQNFILTAYTASNFNKNGVTV
jgi:glycosyltransferase involved in cell wall biosynthesis